MYLINNTENNHTMFDVFCAPDCLSCKNYFEMKRSVLIKWSIIKWIGKVLGT